jgi:hypothetical protein
MHQSHSKEKYTFSRSRGEILFANNFDKCAYVVLIVAAIIYAFSNYPDSLKGAFFYIIVVIPFLMLFSSHFNNAAHKLIIDTVNAKVEFHMYRGKGIISKNNIDIEKVRNGGYITFYFKEGNKILWKKRDDEEVLLNLLEKVTVVESGLM